MAGAICFFLCKNFASCWEFESVLFLAHIQIPMVYRLVFVLTLLMVKDVSLPAFGRFPSKSKRLQSCLSGFQMIPFSIYLMGHKAFGIPLGTIVIVT